MEDFKDVLAFHEKFDLPRDTVLRLMSEDAEKFRVGFLEEEAEEFDWAWDEGNLVKTTDALLDFVYVSIGTGLFIGCPRSGPIGRWPNFREVAEDVTHNGLVLGVDHLAPRLLSPCLQAACIQILKSRIGFFIRAYEAAKKEEDGGLNTSIFALKLCCNTAYSIGAMMHLPWEKCWRHVQNANMGKKRAERDGSDSKRNTQWDVVKPKGWTAPEARIAMELQLAGWKVPEMMLIDNATGKVEMPERV